MEFKSINPYNGKEVAVYNEHTEIEVNQIMASAKEAYPLWRATSFAERAKILKKAGEIVLRDADKFAKMISLEMGKPLAEAKGEVQKCAWVCDYYADNAEKFLQPEVIKTDAAESYVSFEPIGCVLAIMPWNYPFWQVFRFAAPTLMAGNTGLLKHAPNVFGSAKQIEEIFTEAGFPKGVFQNLFINHDKTESIIANPIVQAVTLTGSERAGSAVASLAGKYIKKSLLELGGSNAFIVLKDADIAQAVKVGVQSRMGNSGQSCIAAKRFLVAEAVYDDFVAKFVTAVKNLKAGDPLADGTTVGPLARKDLADQLIKQVNDSVKLGAKVLCGGTQDDAYISPTVMVNITTDMPVFNQETFGPVAPILKIRDIDEAFHLAEMSEFGLGISVFTKDTESVKKHIPRSSDGAFFMNTMVKSDPRLPFGGTKKSGYGRELSKDGILEFVNRKTVYVK